MSLNIVIQMKTHFCEIFIKCKQRDPFELLSIESPVSLQSEMCGYINMCDRAQDGRIQRACICADVLYVASCEGVCVCVC